VSEHAPLGPSAAERWISCPGSIRLGARYDTGESSSYADEGTTAHELAALKVLRAFGALDDDEWGRGWLNWLARHPELTEGDVTDMLIYTDEYVKFVQQLASTMDHPQAVVEVRVDTGVPDCWGTADCVLFSPWEIKVVDFKYGTGVAVDADDNPQLRLYALGVLNAYQGLLGDYNGISMAIAQPRIGIWKTAWMGVDDLYRWRDEVVVPAALLALGDDAPFGPSFEACRWCPAHGRCVAQMNSIFENEFEDSPASLSPSDISAALTAAPAIRAWLAQVDEVALKMAYSEGTPIPGWKVVRSGGRRSIPEPAPAIQALVDAGYPASDVAKVSMLGLGDLEKVVGGRAKLTGILGDLIVKSDGSVSLVPESDRREAVNPEQEAAKAFEVVAP
jgi:hypothetical protein